MIDFITGRDIDIDGLRRMVNYAKKDPSRIYMGEWLSVSSICGTSGCLIGTFCLNEPNDRLRLIGGAPTLSEAYYSNEACVICHSNDICVICNSNEACAVRFSLSYAEALFLFGRSGKGRSAPAMELSGEEAIKRLEKFILYKVRKHEIMEHYETYRRTEGDMMFTKITDEDIVFAESHLM